MTFIIAEAGTGYARRTIVGRKEAAICYANEAKKAGADAVKFQIFVPGEELFCPLPGDEKRKLYWRNCELHFEEWREIKYHCDDLEIDFLASAFQNTTVEWCRKLEVKYYKVAHRANESYPYGMVPGPFIVSVSENDFFWNDDKEHYSLQVVPEYPSPLAKSFWRKFETDGLSDHSGTLWPGLHAIAHGAQFLEVHFDYEKNLDNPDREVCLTIEELSSLCKFNAAMKEGIAK